MKDTESLFPSPRERVESNRNPTDRPCLFFGEHRWLRIHRGATLDVYGCSCGARRSEEGTALRGG